jgi:hypothetical protein
MSSAPATPSAAILWTRVLISECSATGLAPAADHEDVRAVLVLVIGVTLLRLWLVQELEVIEEGVLLSLGKAIGEAVQREKMSRRKTEDVGRILMRVLSLVCGAAHVRTPYLGNLPHHEVSSLLALLDYDENAIALYSARSSNRLDYASTEDDVAKKWMYLIFAASESAFPS